MGISLHMYRCRIGCFNSSSKANSSKQSTKPGTEPRNKFLFTILFILTVSCSAAVFQVYNTNALHKYNPEKFPQLPSKYPSQEPSPGWICGKSQDLEAWPLPCTHQPSTWATPWHSSPPTQGPEGQPSSSTQYADIPVASRWRGYQCIGAWGVDPPQQVTHCSFGTSPYKFTNLCLLE